jgi:hypothetical protein
LARGRGIRSPLRREHLAPRPRVTRSPRLPSQVRVVAMRGTAGGRRPESAPDVREVGRQQSWPVCAQQTTNAPAGGDGGADQSLDSRGTLAHATVLPEGCGHLWRMSCAPPPILCGGT